MKLGAVFPYLLSLLFENGLIIELLLKNSSFRWKGELCVNAGCKLDR